jgi:hypothetical protein
VIPDWGIGLCEMARAITLSGADQGGLASLSISTHPKRSGLDVHPPWPPLPTLQVCVHVAASVYNSMYPTLSPSHA